MVQKISTSLGGLVEKLNMSVDEMKTGLTAMENRFEGTENARSDQATPADRSNDVKDAKRPNEYAYFVAGGYNSNSVEIFDKTTNSWIQLQPMPKFRFNASSVVYNGEVLVTGGLWQGQHVLTSMEQFSRNANPFVPPCWSNLPVNLPRPLRGHRTVLYNGRLIVVGGYDEDGNECDMIYEIQLHFPFTTKVLAKLPPTTPIKGCGAVLANSKILMFGGCTREKAKQATANVTMYDITKNEFKELAPLPYEVCNMATVKCEENVILAGGAAIYPESDIKTTVVSYNIETEESTELPPMKQMRCDCCAVVDGNSLVVMGGYGARSTLNSVEVFDFNTSKWSDLPSMKGARRRFIAEIV
jgi:N-acetylneuraminic acid mutarotase